MTEVIYLDDHKSINPNKDYYNLPLEKRFSEYNRWVWKRASEHKKRVLQPFYDNDKSEKSLTPKELTSELKIIIPSFKGKVLRRDYNATLPNYILSKKDMNSLFGESVFGNFTGKVIISSDNLLSKKHQDLAGYVILIAEQGNEEKEGFIAWHENYHTGHSQYPNAMRREQYLIQLKDQYDNPENYSNAAIVETMIGLDKAIQIDEAGAVLNSYDWLQLITWKPWKPRRNKETYNVELIKKWYNRFSLDFINELKNCSRNQLGFQLDAMRKSGNISNKLIDIINKHERDSMKFPSTIKQTTEKISQKLQNPEGLEQLSYAISYINEALQILDYKEIMASDLEKFCVEILEPHRLNSWNIGFQEAFAKAFRPK